MRTIFRGEVSLDEVTVYFLTFILQSRPLTTNIRNARRIILIMVLKVFIRCKSKNLHELVQNRFCDRSYLRAFFL